MKPRYTTEQYIALLSQEQRDLFDYSKLEYLERTSKFHITIDVITQGQP